MFEKELVYALRERDCWEEYTFGLLLSARLEKEVGALADQVRVRFAPSPTGYLHIGGARTALFNWLFARHEGGKLILRIEDTDADRTIEDSIEQILDGMTWLGMDWDEGPKVGGEYGPYYQSQRRHLYHKAAERLIQSGRGYWCYCTPDELKQSREEAMRRGVAPMYDGKCRRLSEEDQDRLKAEGRKPALRLLTPDTGSTLFDDVIRGNIEFDNAHVGDFVVMKSDGYPTYNFACVVDDASMQISHVIRADEHISNTPKQIMIYESLGISPPKFAHVPMILAPDRSKLSKRHGAMSVQEFRELGYLPEALLNYLAFLGWTPSGESEVLSQDQMIAQFELKQVSKNASIYDIQKLSWMNGHYMRSIDINRLVSVTVPFMQRHGLIGSTATEQDMKYLKAILESMRDRVKTLAEIPEAIEYFYRDFDTYDEKGVKKQFTKPGVAELLNEAATRLEFAPPDLDATKAEEIYRALIAERGISSGQLIHPTRLALTGRTIGPGLFDVIALLGRELSVKRLRQAAASVCNL